MARFALVVAGLALAAATAAIGRPVQYRQRADTVPAALSDAQGSVVAANCSACHSLDYITTQPHGKGAQFWRDEVAKMINVYKAPLAPADADAVAAELDRKFGGTG